MCATENSAPADSMKGRNDQNSIKLQTAKLPSGLSIRHCSSANEVDFLYMEHYKDKVYMQDGITLKPGDVVVDIGANIGMFSMFAAEAVGATGRVLACEPAPSMHAACVANLELHKEFMQAAGTQVAPSEVVPVAVGNESGNVTLTVYPHANCLSTVDNNLTDVRDIAAAHLENITMNPELRPPLTGIVGHLQGATMSACRMVGRAIPATMPALRWVGSVYAKLVLLRGLQEVNVPMVTLSALLKERPDIKRIALLKVDVERAELGVLEGVKDAWPMVQQVAVEVHDSDGRLAAVQKLLSDNGLTEQKLSTYFLGTYQVTARRPA